MTVERHLVLQEMILLPSAEWLPRFEGWLVLRVGEGAGYWLRSETAHELSPGVMLVVPRNNGGLLRASSIGPLKLNYFFVQSRLLQGVLAIVDDQQLDTNSLPGSSPLLWPARDPLALRFSEIAAQTAGLSLTVRVRLLQVWADAVTSLIREPREEREPADLRERFRQLLNQMSQAELSTCSLSDLGEQLHCSERHLSRLFREEFGTSFRAHQTELRLLRARQILESSNTKIINVAYESGYRHLGLFNTMFKKHFGMTPSQWRLKNVKKNSRTALALVCATALAFSSSPAADTRFGSSGRTSVLYLGTPASPDALAQAKEALHQKLAELDAAANGKTNAPVSADSGPKFEVRDYEVRGNTLLRKETIDSILADAKGTNVTFSQIRRSLGNLQTAYRERGYATVAVSLPQQQLTNQTVTIQITEAPLASVLVVNNHYFSSNNVMRALPSLREAMLKTNAVLNSHIFQRELDLANANRDRQIYPILGPGAEVGTSELTLKVKDRFPLHGRGELNNDATPGTPPLRFNLNAQYGNLWDRDHQLGLQYSFTPEELKQSPLHQTTFFDEPLIANYSGFYRIPLGETKALEKQVAADPLNFGYNEATHQFRLPPAPGQAALTVFASRSTSDTGIKLSPPQRVTEPTDNPSIISQDSGEDLTLNEGIGTRLAFPLKEIAGVKSTLSIGVDFKRFRLTSFNTNNIDFTISFPDATTGETITQHTNSALGQIPHRAALDYLPWNLELDGSVEGILGTTFFNSSIGFNFANGLANDRDFAKTASSTNATAGYVKVNLGLSHELKFYKDWTVFVHADGQWADGPLISNEQYALGGLGGVRGYREGEAYGDSGWRLQIEPRTPLVNLGMVDNNIPCWVRGSIFLDLGETFLKTDSGEFSRRFKGVGWGVTASIGDHFDARFIMAWPLIDSPQTQAEVARIYFGVGAQF